MGNYRPNAWGLYDMHGNVWEWTRSIYRPYPYVAGDGRNGTTGEEPVTARGGSWRDRPKQCRSASRLSYPAWQRVFNVGFRVVIGTPEVHPLTAPARCGSPGRLEPTLLR